MSALGEQSNELLTRQTEVIERLMTVNGALKRQLKEALERERQLQTVNEELQKQLKAGTKHNAALKSWAEQLTDTLNENAE